MRDVLVNETAETSSLFDSLARLVPEELQTEYYRVVAHAQTLSPDDEMLRVLEAMGVLALIVRQTPADIAEQREKIKGLLDQHLQTTRQTQRNIIELGKDIDSRLSGLPSEIEMGLNPTRIAGLLGESLRQHLASTGMKETVASLEQAVTLMQKTQQHLNSALREVGDPSYGIAAKVEDTNRRISQSVEARSARVDEFLHELRTDLLRVWIPVIAGACLVLGLILGTSLLAWRDSSQPTVMTVPAQVPDSSLLPPDSIEQPPAKALHHGTR